jgi:hypothetical protein
MVVVTRMSTVSYTYKTRTYKINIRDETLGRQPDGYNLTIMRRVYMVCFRRTRKNYNSSSWHVHDVKSSYNIIKARMK